ncbi:MAG TPA: hypothetical protein VK612_03855, partial [Pyrinomonadaceae bacterium]|nr:hypothetical protein [Pyrinomonadaceae bacterium]
MKFLLSRNYIFVLLVHLLCLSISVAAQTPAKGAAPQGSFVESPLFLIVAVLVVGGLVAGIFVIRSKSKSSKDIILPDMTGRNLPASKLGPKGGKVMPFMPAEAIEIGSSTKTNADRYSRMAAKAAASTDVALRSKMDLSGLPISLVLGLQLPAPIVELEASDDESLLNAIDEFQDDSDADSEFRNL